MFAPLRSEPPRETDQVQEQRGNPRVDPVLLECCSEEQTPPQSPVGAPACDEDALETFVHGAGI